MNNKGHYHCDICAMDTCNINIDFTCYWEEIGRRHEILKLWGACRACED